MNLLREQMNIEACETRAESFETRGTEQARAGAVTEMRHSSAVFFSFK